MKILRELREKRGLTLEQVAEGVGLRNQYISNYELGKRRPDYDTICKLADFFGVSVDYLLFWTKMEMLHLFELLMLSRLIAVAI